MTRREAQAQASLYTSTAAAAASIGRHLLSSPGASRLTPSPFLFASLFVGPDKAFLCGACFFKHCTNLLLPLHGPDFDLDLKNFPSPSDFGY